MTVIGTRPEAIKLAPVILAGRASPAEFDVRVVRTGQHRELVDELAMLSGAHDANVELRRRRASGKDHGSELDRLRAGADHRHQAEWSHVSLAAATVSRAAAACVRSAGRTGCW